jgi:putative transposase
MKSILYTYKFRLEPTQDQQVLLNKHFGSVRYVYNYFLNQRIEFYKKDDKKSLSYYDNANTLVELKKQDNIWLNEINSQSLQYSLKCIDISFKRFFKKISKFPKFKTKKSKNSFTIPQHVKIKENKLFIPKFKDGIKMITERTLEGKIKRATITKTPTNKYFVTILVEKEYIPKNKTNKSIGIDLGVTDFLITSDGSKVKNHRFLKSYQKKLKTNQQHLSRKTKGSNRYEKQRLKVARIHEKIVNSRMDLIHKTALDLIQKYDNIYLEDLNIKGLTKRCKSKKDQEGNFIPNGQSKKSGLNKSILDVAWGTFIRTLEYKALWNDKSVVKVGRFFPSSKMCNKCGWLNKDLKLERTWVCICGESHDRDHNAALNILNEGFQMERLNTNVEL